MKKFSKEFKIVLDSMDVAGYNNYWSVLNAKDYSVPQNRERVFIMFIRKDIDKGYKFPEPIGLNLRLKDVLEKDVGEKFYLNQKAVDYMNRSVKDGRTHWDFGFHNDSVEDVANCITANYRKGVPYNVLIDREHTERIIQVGNITKPTKYKNPTTGRVYDVSGLSPTLNTCGGGNRMPIIVEPFCVASRGRYDENGKVQQHLEPRFDGMINTLTTVQKDNYVVEPNTIIDDTQGFDGVRYYDKYNPTLRANRSGLKTVDDQYRIRKLTPKECFRLMGFDDSDVGILIENKISNTQLYKMAGNSICVPVLEAIFENLYEQYKEELKNRYQN